MVTKLVDGKRVEMTEEEIISLEKSRKTDIVVLKSTLISERKHYLRETDWYVVREHDNSVVCPQEIKDKRQLARAEIDEIETATEETIKNY